MKSFIFSKNVNSFLKELTADIQVMADGVVLLVYAKEPSLRETIIIISYY